MFYKTDHPMLMPKSTDIPFGTMSIEELKKLPSDLTENEKKAPHAKYFYEVPVELSEEHRAVIAGGPMDPADAFEMQDYGKYMNNTGYCKVENGYCVLPSGITFAAVKIDQNGRTDEMVDYYNKYFAPEDSLFYKIWYPGCHYIHFCDGALEDFGFGRVNMKFIGQVEVEPLGIRYEDVVKNDPACISINGTIAEFYNIDSDDPDKPIIGTLVFYHRLTDNGREMRMRMWCGIAPDGKGGYIIDKVPEEEALNVAKCTMMHLMQEYSDDEYLERKFWADTHPE